METPDGQHENQRGKRPALPELSGLRALALVGQVGLTVAIPTVAGVFTGRYLDRRFGGTGLVLVGMLLLGVAVGLYCACRILLREVDWKH